MHTRVGRENAQLQLGRGKGKFCRFGKRKEKKKEEMYVGESERELSVRRGGEINRFA